MTNAFFSHVLDDPIYIGNNEYLSIVTQGKNNGLDVSKETNAKAGVLRVNAETGQTAFIDLYTHSDSGDRYRAGVMIDDKVYIMRTQKEFVDSKVRIAIVNTLDNEVEMLEDNAVAVHGSIVPKLFCGHFNFGRPVVVGKKIIYPPLNSGVLIVFDTEARKFYGIDVPTQFSSIWATFVPELNQVVFFPYGDTSSQIMTLDMKTMKVAYVASPEGCTFYNAFTYNGKAYGAPLRFGQAQTASFWTYDGSTVTASEYVFEDKTAYNVGLKYGIVDGNQFIGHTCYEQNREVIKFDLDTGVVTACKTDLELGATPVKYLDTTYLFPSIQSKDMQDAPNAVYTLNSDGTVATSFALPTNNVSYSPINGHGDKLILVPYRFEYDAATSKVSSQVTVVDLKAKSAHTIDINLDVA